MRRKRDIYWSFSVNNDKCEIRKSVLDALHVGDGSVVTCYDYVDGMHTFLWSHDMDRVYFDIFMCYNAMDVSSLWGAPSVALSYFKDRYFRDKIYASDSVQIALGECEEEEHATGEHSAKHFAVEAAMEVFKVGSKLKRAQESSRLSIIAMSMEAAKHSSNLEWTRAYELAEKAAIYKHRERLRKLCYQPAPKMGKFRNA